MIDMDSKARLKGTLTGAGVGGAMGAFTAYQGAQSEIEQRWVSEVRAYKDSLQKVVCMTGNRFLSQYNDPVSIPPLSEQGATVKITPQQRGFYCVLWLKWVNSFAMLSPEEKQRKRISNVYTCTELRFFVLEVPGF